MYARLGHCSIYFLEPLERKVIEDRTMYVQVYVELGLLARAYV
jgi:hypothetical protein